MEQRSMYRVEVHVSYIIIIVCVKLRRTKTDSKVTQSWAVFFNQPSNMVTVAYCVYSPQFRWFTDKQVMSHKYIRFEHCVTIGSTVE